jgi:hypothetical protein
VEAQLAAEPHQPKKQAAPAKAPGRTVAHQVPPLRAVALHQWMTIQNTRHLARAVKLPEPAAAIAVAPATAVVPAALAAVSLNALNDKEKATV